MVGLRVGERMTRWQEGASLTSTKMINWTAWVEAGVVYFFLEHVLWRMASMSQVSRCRCRGQERRASSAMACVVAERNEFVVERR